MLHRIKGRKLGRNSAHRKALIRNLAIAFVEHEFIKTTLPKAKEVKPFIEKLLTLSKKDNLSNRRRAISILGSESIVNKLFKDVAPRIESRNGGYIRILKCGFRTGDKADMAIMELVDRKAEEEVAEEKPAKAAAKK